MASRTGQRTHAAGRAPGRPWLGRLALVAGAAVALQGVLLLGSLLWLRPFVAARLVTVLERPVALGRATLWLGFPTVRLRLHDLRVGDADPARAPLVTAATVDARVALPPLLRGVLVLPAVGVADGTVELAGADDDSSMATLPGLGIRTLTLARIGVRGGDGPALGVAAATLRSEPDGLALDAHGDVDGVVWSVAGTGGALAALVEGTAPWPFRVDARAGGWTARADATLDRGAPRPRVTGAVTVEPPAPHPPALPGAPPATATDPARALALADPATRWFGIADADLAVTVTSRHPASPPAAAHVALARGIVTVTPTSVGLAGLPVAGTITLAANGPLDAWPIAVDLRVGTLAVGLTGTARDLARIEGALTLAGEADALALRAQVSATPTTITLHDLQGTVAGRPIAGTVTAVRPPGGTPTVSVDLAAPGTCDAIEATLTPVAGGPRPAFSGRVTCRGLLLGTGTGRARAATPSPLDVPLPAAWLRAVDLDVALDLPAVRAGATEVGSLIADVRLADGVLRAPLRGTLAGGTLAGRLDVDAQAAPPKVHVRGRAAGVHAAVLVRAWTGDDVVTGGEGGGTVDLRSTGATARAALAAADGEIALDGGAGRLRTRTIGLWATDLVPTLLASTRRNREETTVVNCVSTRLTVRDGRATTHDLVIDTSRMTVVGAGTVVLATGALDLVLSPAPKGAGLVSLAAPVRVGGTLGAPAARLDPGLVARRTAGGLVDGLTAPGALLGRLGGTGRAAGNPCRPGPVARGGGPAPAAPSQPDGGGIVEGATRAVEGVGRSVGRFFRRR